MTGIAQLVWPRQAGGSLVVEGGRPVGSALIGQPFSRPEYFWSRPSATAPFPYNAAVSSGSNLGPTNPALAENAAKQLQALAAGEDVPVDLVTASASGLDPHISPAAARVQIARVAAARGLDEQAVARLVDAHTEPRTLGLFGEPRVNVLLLNLALDRAAPP